ncbi:MAG TPA: ParB/RepB/Spo0J family partition protein [Clostridiales bacterium]|jgi:ParB family chromosome partitioning protein|nr:ParB/RepB/Spo0J family partition protein [Clostridiales bacterium]
MTNKKQVLGRGLDALFSDYEAPQDNTGVLEVDIRLIDNNPAQPRQDFDEEKLQELSESIKRHGIVQPIIVTKNKDRYTIVAGERRFRAARLAGLSTVPVLVKPFLDEQLFEIALIENIQRENLNPIEEAKAISFLIQQHDLTQDEAAQRLGKSRSAVANSLRLLNLSEIIQKMLKTGSINTGHAKVLLGVKNEQKREELAIMVSTQGLSVRELERIIQAGERKREIGKLRSKQKNSPEVKAIVGRMQKALATKVELIGDLDKGRLVIEYYSQADLEALYNLICGNEE